MNMKNSMAAAVLAVGLAAMPLAAQRGFAGHGMHGGMMGQGAGPGFGDGRMLEHLAVVLDLTEAQKQFAQKLATDTRAEAKPILDQIKQNREEMQAAVKSNNTGNISNLATRQGNLMGQLSAIHAKAMASFYAQLTPEQKAKADKLHDTMRNRADGMRERMKNRQPANQQQ